MMKAERYSADTVTESYVQRAGILNLWTLLITAARHFLYIIVSDIYWLKYHGETEYSSWKEQLHSFFQTAVNWPLSVTRPQWVLILGHNRFLHILSHSWFTVIHSFKANYSTYFFFQYSFLCLFSCFVRLGPILCILCFCVVLCLVSPFICTCLSSVFVQAYLPLWAGQLSRYSDWLRAGRSGDRIPVGARFSASVQTGPGADPVSCTMGTGSFPRVKSGRGVTLTPHPLLVPWSRKSGAIPLLHLWVVLPVQRLSACTRVNFTFAFTLPTTVTGWKPSCSQ